MVRYSKQARARLVMKPGPPPVKAMWLICRVVTFRSGSVDLQWVQQVEWDSMTPEPNTAPDPAKDEQ
jgi:hypothetical protein